MSVDLEVRKKAPKYLKGYPSLAAFIAKDCYNNNAVYRRFNRLSARNILQLQSDLMELEVLQDALDEEDIFGSRKDKASARDWDLLKEESSGGK